MKKKRYKNHRCKYDYNADYRTFDKLTHKERQEFYTRREREERWLEEHCMGYSDDIEEND